MDGTPNSFDDCPSIRNRMGRLVRAGQLGVLALPTNVAAGTDTTRHLRVLPCDVPRGYHPVVVPRGRTSYHLDVMAGPQRVWHFHNDPAHAWMLAPTA